MLKTELMKGLEFLLMTRSLRLTIEIRPVRWGKVEKLRSVSTGIIIYMVSEISKI